MIQRKYNLNLCLAIALGAVLLALALGALQKQFGIFGGADAAAIRAVNAMRLFYPLTFVMYVVSWLGDEMGLMIVICVVYWLGHSTEAVAFLLALLFGNIINSHMKEFFELSRPLDSEISKLYGADGYGYPSGHSQTGMLYSWLIYMFAQKYWPLCLIAAFLMAASRIYLGVHYFSDTVGGLICGFGVVVAATGIYGHVRELGPLRESIRKSFALKVALSLAISAAYLILAQGLDGDFKYAGLLAGFFIIYSMLGFRWRSRNKLCNTVMIVLGLIVLLFLRISLKMILPENNLGDYSRYFILGVMLAGSPFVFVKMKLLKVVDDGEPEK